MISSVFWSAPPARFESSTSALYRWTSPLRRSFRNVTCCEDSAIFGGESSAVSIDVERCEWARLHFSAARETSARAFLRFGRRA